MSKELSESRKEFLAAYGGTVFETICRELTAIDDPGIDPDHRPLALGGLPWWTMKIRKAIKYRPLLEKAYDDGFAKGQAQAIADAGLLARPLPTLAEAWEEGHEAAAMRIPEGVWHDTASPRPTNPYRKDRTDER